jgi:hypothetical protein
MNTARNGVVIVTAEAALKERLHRLTEDSTDHNEVAAVNLLAAGVSLLIAAKGHHATIEMLERTIAFAEEDRAARLTERVPLATKPTIPTQTGGNLSLLGMRRRGALRN